MRAVIQALLFVFAILVVPKPAQAEWVGGIPVLTVRPHEGGCILLQTTPGWFNASGYLVIDPSKPGANRMYSAALAAKLAGRTISVWRYHGNHGCWAFDAYTISDLQVD